jgi:hypothetical protein
MPIVAEFGPGVEEYIEFDKQYSCPRPGDCPICGAAGQMIGHGYYLRKPKGLEKGYVLWVKRWKCKACGHTVGAVPSFLLFYRHYLLSVIHLVLGWRFDGGYSWSQLNQHVSEDGVPAVRTMQRWCGRFVEYALVWLEAVEKMLAEQDSRAAWLDAQGEALEMQGEPQALLRVSLYLLSWAKGRWREIESFGLNDRLRLLWYWGTRQGGFSRLA